MAKVRPARRTAKIADSLARAKASHDLHLPNDKTPAPRVRCAHCGRVGTRVLFRTRRFHR